MKQNRKKNARGGKRTNALPTLYRMDSFFDDKIQDILEPYRQPPDNFPKESRLEALAFPIHAIDMADSLAQAPATKIPEADEWLFAYSRNPQLLLNLQIAVNAYYSLPEDQKTLGRILAEDADNLMVKLKDHQIIDATLSPWPNVARNPRIRRRLDGGANLGNPSQEPADRIRKENSDVKMDRLSKLAKWRENIEAWYQVYVFPSPETVPTR